MFHFGTSDLLAGRYAISQNVFASLCERAIAEKQSMFLQVPLTPACWEGAHRIVDVLLRCSNL